jgi:co-chaperonin GroES (HSP10)
MELKPTKDVIVLKGWEPPTVSEGGIALPGNLRKGPNQDKIAVVMEVGCDVTLVKTGDKVAWTPSTLGNKLELSTL